MPVVKELFDAILFDMDGTLVDSTKGVIGAWHTFTETYPHLDVKEILNTSHGVRTVDNLRIHCGITDPEELETEATRFEQEIVNCSRKDGAEGIVLLPGVQSIIDNLKLGSESSKTRWAICTSATKVYASAALRITGIPIPSNFVTAEDVQKGKPSPDPYLLGAKLCGADPRRCLVVEDAPAGIASGRAAGAKVLALVTSHSREAVQEAEPNFLVNNLSSVQLKITTGGIELSYDTNELDQ